MRRARPENQDTAEGGRPPALERALRLLARRPHFRAEVETKLARAGYEREEIASAVARLAELGYLDDAALAKAEADRLRERDHLGRTAVRARLARKGVGGPEVAGALAGAGEDEELAVATRAAERWLRGRGPAGDGAALARHLARKGFGARVIVAVLRAQDLPLDPAEDSDGVPES